MVLGMVDHWVYHNAYGECNHTARYSRLFIFQLPIGFLCHIFWTVSSAPAGVMGYLARLASKRPAGIFAASQVPASDWEGLMIDAY